MKKLETPGKTGRVVPYVLHPGPGGGTPIKSG